MKALLKSLKDSAVRHGEMQCIDDINQLEKYIDDLRQQAEAKPIPALLESQEEMLPYGCVINIQTVNIILGNDIPPGMDTDCQNSSTGEG